MDNEDKVLFTISRPDRRLIISGISLTLFGIGYSVSILLTGIEDFIANASFLEWVFLSTVLGGPYHFFMAKHVREEEHVIETPLSCHLAAPGAGKKSENS